MGAAAGSQTLGPCHDSVTRSITSPGRLMLEGPVMVSVNKSKTKCRERAPRSLWDGPGCPLPLKFQPLLPSCPKGAEICDVTLTWLIQVTSQYAPASSRLRVIISDFRDLREKLFLSVIS